MYNIVNNKETNRFEVTDLPGTAILDYEWSGDSLVLVHTFVSESLRGKGLAQELAAFAMEYIKSHHYKAIIKCPYVASYLKHHPEYNPLVIATIANKE